MANETITSLHGPRLGLDGLNRLISQDPVTGKQVAITAKPGPVAPVTAAKVLTEQDAGPKAITLNAAAGQAITLPAATGSGNIYRLFVGTTITSNNTTIKVANGTDTMVGRAIVTQDAGDTVVGFEASGAHDTITLNGSTTGGIKGDIIMVEDVAAGLFHVDLRLSGTGAEVTPFSATVS